MKKSVIASIVILGVIFLFSILLLNPMKLTGSAVVFLGDSIIGNVIDETSVTAIMSEMLGTEVFNGGLGGTLASMSRGTNSEAILEEDIKAVGLGANTYSNDIENAMTLVMIARCICTHDFSQILAAKNVRRDGDLTYFDDCLVDISRVDYRNVDILLIEHGTNDYLSGKEILNEANPYDVNTYIGALRYSISYLQKTYPDMKIVLVTPMYNSCAFDSIRYPLTDYIDAELNLASELKVPVLDAYEAGIVNADNVNEVTIDGLHLNEKGRQEYASFVAEFLKSLK